jgi:murein DD-endopeptidase MepM/ murein hydrolase activator NlpD
MNSLCRIVISLAFVVSAITGGAVVHADNLVSWKGEFKQGSLLLGFLKDLNVESISTAKRTLIINPDGSFAVGLGRDFGSDLVLTFKMKDGREIVKSYKVAARKYNIQKVTGVPQKTVTPDPEHLKRIRKESALVRKARAESVDTAYYLEEFMWPSIGIISGVYGSQRYYNGHPRRPHYGLDIAAPKGTAVVLPASGFVVLAEKDLFFSGGTVIVDHGHGISSTFLHMSKLHVEVGDKLKQGALVGEIGSTGRATGAHLDWRMNWFDQRVDPRMLMSERVPPAK